MRASQKDDNEPSYTRISNAIREDLVLGAFAPGQRLKMNDLAQRYDAGANAVREALQQLSGEGWIIISPNRGAVVRPITATVIRDIYELREALEACTTVKFVDSASPNDIRHVQDIQAQFDSAAQRNDDETCSRKNSEFHQFINEKAGNAEIVEVIARYGRLMGSIRRHIGYGNGRADQVAKEHHLLIKAFIERDKVLVRETITMHLRRSCEDILSRYLKSDTAKEASALYAGGRS